MDQRTESLQREIDTTRDLMAQKLEQVESQVKGTAESVKTSVEQTVENVKQNLDISRIVNDRPWTMFGASVLAGFVVGSMSAGSSEQNMPHVSYRETPTYRYYERSQDEPRNQAYHYYDRSEHRSERGTEKIQSAMSSTMSDAMSRVSDEMDVLKDAAITTLTRMLHSTLHDNFPQLAEEFERVRSERERQRTGQQRPSNGGAEQPATRPSVQPTSIGEASVTESSQPTMARTVGEQVREGQTSSMLDPKVTRGS